MLALGGNGMVVSLACCVTCPTKTMPAMHCFDTQNN